MALKLLPVLVLLVAVVVVTQADNSCVNRRRRINEAVIALNIYYQQGIVDRKKGDALTENLCKGVSKSEQNKIAECIKYSPKGSVVLDSIECNLFTRKLCKSHWTKVFDCWGDFKNEAIVANNVDNCFEYLNQTLSYSLRCQALDNGVPIDCLPLVETVNKTLDAKLEKSDVTENFVRKRVKSASNEFEYKAKNYFRQNCLDQFFEFAAFLADKKNRRVLSSASKAPSGPQLYPGSYPYGFQQPYMQPPAQPMFGNYWSPAFGPARLQLWPMYG